MSELYQVTLWARDRLLWEITTVVFGEQRPPRLKLLKYRLRPETAILFDSTRSDKLGDSQNLYVRFQLRNNCCEQIHRKYHQVHRSLHHRCSTGAER